MLSAFLVVAALGLKDLYRGEFDIGVAASPAICEPANRAAAALVVRDFNALTAENAMKPAVLQPREGVFDFAAADRLVDFASAKGIAVTGHCLVWHQQTPDWFFKGADGKDCDRETLIVRMRAHIAAVMRHYRGRVKGWDVVNEALGGDGELHDSPWLRIIGGDYVELAFRFAHEADPDAELYYNDFGLDLPAKRAGVVRLVRTLRAKGLRIDAVGMQSHGSLTAPDLAEYEKSIEAFGAEGVKVMATELDVSVLPSAWHVTAELSADYAYDEKLNPWPRTLPVQQDADLAARYAALFRIYRRHRDVVTRVTIWGLQDGESWLNNFPMKGRTDYPLLYGRDLKAKRCRAAVAAVAKERIRVVPCVRKGPFARFTKLVCRGEEKLAPCDPDRQYRNPIIGGMAADPSITRKGDWFYLANSSFSYFPGIPVRRSRDLVSWELCGYAGSRPSNLALPKGVDLSGGVFAPDIKYNPYNDTFYLVVTVIGGAGTVVYKTKAPELGWSEPIPIPVGGIDPSFYFEDATTAWILNNDDAPDGKPEYDGHRTVRMRRYDLVSDRCVPNTERIIINKGVRPEEKPIWCEGPHLYKIDGRYYVMTAEGGTGGGHAEVIWTAERVEGPYRPCPVNPILTQRDLPWGRPDPITAAGHADLVQTPGGDWMAVFLAIDPYQANGRDWCNTGRSTYLLPVEWIGSGTTRQPVILPAGKTVPRVAEKTAWMKRAGAAAQPCGGQRSGNVSFSDAFRTPKIDAAWFALRGPATFATSGDGLRLEPTEDGLDSRGTPAYLARWVCNKDFTFAAAFEYDVPATGGSAGLCYYQNERERVEIAKTRVDGQACLVLRETTQGVTHTRATASVPENGDLRVCLVSHRDTITCFWTLPGGGWKPLGEPLSATHLSTDHAGGFVGATVGPFIAHE